MTEVITKNAGFLFLALGLMWLIQFGLAYWQMNRFYRRIFFLRKSGLTAVGLSGNRYKGRSYGVLTINEKNQVVHAEQFSGWTILSQLKPVPGLVGMSLSELLNNESNLPVPKKLQTAFGNAARDLQAARDKAEAETTPQTDLGIIYTQ